MVPFYWLHALALSYSTGAPLGACQPNSVSLPLGYEENSEGHTISLSMDQDFITLDCQTKNGNQQTFKGFLITTDNGEIEYSGDDGQLKTTQCLTHNSKTPKTSVTFKVTKRSANVRAVVVFQKATFGHYGAITALFVPPKTTNALVIGAGPGGLGAARELLKLGYPDVLVYEQGPDLPDGFFDGKISSTSQAELYQKQSALITVETGYPLGQGPGGTQNINGAVYSPGTPEDLAQSLGVTLQDATHAQKAASEMVMHHPETFENNRAQMMWSCDFDKPGEDCDFVSVTSTNQKMKRRSIAFDLPANIKIVTGCKVDRIEDAKVFVVKNEGECQDWDITDDRFVIVAAGALTSPRLLGNMEFSYWNHYYNVVFQPWNDQIEYQEIAFNGTHEVNTAKLTSIAETGPVNRLIKITMEMKTKFRDTFMADPGSITDTGKDRASLGNAWHFAGSVSHQNLKVEDKVFIGDASALMTPFNCHTSMPAVAAGVLAARSATIGLDVPVANPKMDGPAPLLFALGAWIILLGVMTHFHPKTKWMHYYITPTGAAVIAAAIVSVHSKDYRLEKGSIHAYQGYAVSGLLLAQIITGSALRGVEKRPRWLQIPHRASGILVLAGLNALYIQAVTKDMALRSYTRHRDAYYVTAWLYLAVSVGTVIFALFRLKPYFARPTFSSDMTNNLL